MNRIFKYRGIRIYPHHKHLLFHYLLSTFFSFFLLNTILFYWNILTKLTLKNTSWPFIKSLPWSWLGLILSIVISITTTAVLVTILRIRFDNFYQQLRHRQKLARMILENNWYETSTQQSEGYFKDLSSQKSKEKISYFPRVYYLLKDGLIHIQVEIVMSSYQDQLLHLEKKLEAGLFCEMVDKVLHNSFVEYTLLYDTIANRIQIEDVTCDHGEMRLMKTVTWKYDSLPHMLIAGGTGGGKTYFILTLIEALLKTNAQLTILDPKNADLADLEAVLPDVHFQKEDMIAALNDFYNAMMARNEAMKKMDGYKTGENYAYLELPAHFLIFDEYVAFMDMLGREAITVMSKLKQIVMLGRQSGFFLILACQRPDAKYLGDGIRDQFMFRIALGRMSELGYTMMFGETNKDFFQKPIKGRGYIDTGGSVISEFYTPMVPRKYDFLTKIEAAYLSMHTEKQSTPDN